jgi:Zn-dependent peptidase ImmA (M78 family)
VLKSDLRKIYRQEGIRIDLWPHFKGLRGAYFHDEHGATVVLNANLPEDPRVFTMAHELKHHLVDRALGLAFCDVGNQNEEIEIGAEVFAAELIFPEQDFIDALTGMGVGRGQCTAESLVRLKTQTRTTLSYAGLAKTAVRLKFAPEGAFDRVKWRKLEERLNGEPVYKRIQRYRKRRGGRA